jgi:ATP-dependent Clp protease adaptor protein ClpS
LPKIEKEIETVLEVVEPTKYKVLLHNDDYTSMDFVVEILMGVFHKNLLESEQIMLDIHKKGRAICGIYTFEIAQTKVQQVKTMAKSSGFPLLATLEEE